MTARFPALSQTTENDKRDIHRLNKIDDPLLKVGRGQNEADDNSSRHFIRVNSLKIKIKKGLK